MQAIYNVTLGMTNSPRSVSFNILNYYLSSSWFHLCMSGGDVVGDAGNSPWSAPLSNGILLWRIGGVEEMTLFWDR